MRRLAVTMALALALTAGAAHAADNDETPEGIVFKTEASMQYLASNVVAAAVCKDCSDEFRVRGRDFRIRKIERKGNDYRLEFARGYAFPFLGVTAKTMTWHSLQAAIRSTGRQLFWRGCRRSPQMRQALYRARVHYLVRMRAARALVQSSAGQRVQRCRRAAKLNRTTFGGRAGSSNFKLG
jgi:hypothetical protein